MTDPSPLSPRRFSFLLTVLTATLPGQKKAAAEPAKSEPKPEQSQFDKALARYQECIKRLPFLYHTDGRQKLAESRKPEALAILAKDYTQGRQYPEYTRYTVAMLIGQHFKGGVFVDALKALREANQKPVDAWLWYQALAIEAKVLGTEAALALATQGKQVWQRAAAILALGDVSPSALAQAILATCAAFPRKDREGDRNLLLGAMSGAILENRREVKSLEFKVAMSAYIGLLADSVGLSHTAKIQVARHLQWVLDGPALFVNPEPWLELLERGEVRRPAAANTVVQPRFFGIESEGEHFCYVIDMSDSMCKPIAPSVRPAAPVTGPKKKPKGMLPDESDLPWHLIDTRWDLAREQLKISLRRLPPDKHFAVVWFGNESGTLDSTKGMIKATPGNVAKVCEELDSIKPGPPDQLKAPDGVLRGNTNMHSGLRRAFGLCGEGYIDEAAYVDPAALRQGCDTVFLLSDGEPSWDDFSVDDTNYHEGEIVHDVEYKKKAPDAPRVTYYGPFHDPTWLRRDFERMNAFRRIRMHCIGIGEANGSLLRALAEVGRGEVYFVGAPKPGSGGGR
jgi:hypothetical protein